MTRISLLCSIGMFTQFGCSGRVRPAETFEQQYTVFGSWTYDMAADFPVVDTQLDMMAKILPEQPVLLVVNDLTECDDYKNDLVDVYGVDATHIDEVVEFRCEEIEHTDIWFRDMAGVFVFKGILALSNLADSVRHLTVVDYGFDGWGYSAFSSKEQQKLYETDDAVAHQLGLALGAEIISSDLITEGGAFQANGEGTIIASLGAMQQRNPLWTTTAIEAELKRTLGAQKVIFLQEWLPVDGHAVLHGPLWLDGVPYQLPFTVMHADEYIQFLDHDTVLIAQIDQEDVRNDIDQATKDFLDGVWTQMSQETDSLGHPFELIAFPEPGFLSVDATSSDVIWFYLGDLDPLPAGYDPNGGKLALPASYMNYVVSNGDVLVAKIYKDGRDPRLAELDQEAVDILMDLYPDREIHQIDPEGLWRGGGGMHCITQQVWTLGY